MKFHLLISCLLLSFIGISQNINFQDKGLKAYFVNELCVDTTNSFWGTGHTTVDINMDGEIQVSEAEVVTQLIIRDFSGTYAIYSVEDLTAFKNLKWVSIVDVDSLVEISDLGLDSLTHLWIGSNESLRYIDVSDLTALTASLRIEDLDTIDYLNIQNGSKAEVFSLFYSEHIHYACVDSIADEYNETAWRMIDQPPTLINCLNNPFSTAEISTTKIALYPNPAQGLLFFEADQSITQIEVYNQWGVLSLKFSSPVSPLDVSGLKTGIYHIKVLSQRQVSFQSLLIR